MAAAHEDEGGGEGRNFDNRSEELESYHDRREAGEGFGEGEALAEDIVAEAPPASSSTRSRRRLHEAFFERSEVSPDGIAIKASRVALTYGELARRVRQRASLLAHAGVTAGMRCVIAANRNVDLIESILALSALGATFSVLDCQYPDARLAELIGWVQPTLVLCDVEQTAARIRPLCDAQIFIAAAFVDEGDAHWKQELPDPTEDEIAYILFTSGSTGRPKMLGIGHGAVARFVDWQASYFGIGEGDRTTMLSGLSHDPVMRDIFLPLSTGGTLCIPQQAMLGDPRSLVEWLLSCRPTVMHATPPLGRLLISAFHGRPRISGLKHIFWGGDLLGRDVTAAWAAGNDALRQTNFYGATETPQAVCFHELDSHDLDVAPIGQPVLDVVARICDDHGAELEVGLVGELRVVTPYAVFRADDNGKFQRLPNEYRTGDMARVGSAGAFTILGRLDDQVKIRGYRIEIEEVARHLRAVDGVDEACVVKTDNGDGTVRLIGHVAPQCEVPDKILAALRATLPSYMVPSSVVGHSRLPRLPNGKIDKVSLISGSNCEMPLPDEVSDHVWSAHERQVANVIAEVLRRAVPDVTQSLGTLGLDSLSSIQLQLALEEVVPGLPLEWVELSVRELALLIGKTSPKTVWDRIFGPAYLEFSPLFRAVATFLIVALHFHWFATNLGTTTVLFFLAGYSFSKFQLPEILKAGTPAIMLRTLGSVASLAAPVSLAVYAAQSLRGMPTDASTLLFFANFRDFVGAERNVGAIVWLWFIHCYLQIFVVIYGVLSWGAVRSLIQLRPMLALSLAFSILAIARFLVPTLLVPDFDEMGATPGLKWDQLPTAQGATVLLGMLAARAVGVRAKALMVLVAAIYAFSVAAYFPNTNPVVLVSAAVILLFFKAIKVPGIIARVALLLSSSSLFIYLMHAPLHAVYTMTGLPGSAAFLTMLVMISSPALWRVWNWAYARVLVAMASVLKAPRSATDAAFLN